MAQGIPLSLVIYLPACSLKQPLTTTLAFCNAIMAKMPQKKNRPARVLARVRKDIGMARRTKGARFKPLSRKNATVVLTQGAVAAPKRVFGTRHGRQRSIRQCIKLLDARLPQTLGLPRAVGPYTVMRTTTLVNSSAKFVMFAPFFNTSTTSWYDWCGIESVDPAQNVIYNNNTKPINMPMLALGEACSVVPAAMTVQVMNPSSLNHATGIFAMARLNQSMCLGTQPTGVTYNDMVQRVISYFSPRMLTGGRLALRAVKSSAYPLDMNEYADFNPIQKYNDLYTWNSSSVRPAALSPICFVQDVNQNPQGIEFMVTIEWRVRFDPGHPAAATHTYHETLPDEIWNGIVKGASDAGHGVEDVAEEVADLGDPFN